MSIDEAIAQLEFNDKKGAKIMKEVRLADWPAVLQSSILAKLQMCVMILSVACSQVLLEAQEMAVKNHNVEYKSNLYVGECAALVLQWG